jgi:hypothetical protein
MYSYFIYCGGQNWKGVSEAIYLAMHRQFIVVVKIGRV